jgi:hypothetical protein
MTAESYLESKLQKFSILDLALIKSVYFVSGLLICLLYPKLLSLGWWFYLLLTVLCSMPLSIHLLSQKGNLLEKTTGYLKTNNPSNQVLLFLSVFFFSLIIGVLFPVITHAYWWVYLIIIACLAIKPLRTSWVW